ncbi:MAG: response regulator [Planctomycetota bacterium]
MARILIAEDDPSMRTMMTDVVTELGHEAFSVESGHAAADILVAEDDIDLLITDMRMPNGPGRELVERLLDNPTYRDLAIIVVSGYATADEVAVLTARGRTLRFLAKPFPLDTLRENIRLALGEDY